jgi:hypothetical protein
VKTAGRENPNRWTTAQQKNTSAAAGVFLASQFPVGAWVLGRTFGLKEQAAAKHDQRCNAQPHAVRSDLPFTQRSGDMVYTSWLD